MSEKCSSGIKKDPNEINKSYQKNLKSKLIDKLGGIHFIREKVDCLEIMELREKPEKERLYCGRTFVDHDCTLATEVKKGLYSLVLILFSALSSASPLKKTC